MEPVMEPWDWKHTTSTNNDGQVIEHVMELGTASAWVDVKLPDGGVIRVDGAGIVWRQSY